ncbi:MAG TPA: plastocyanin/azurin family copper-binding protein [Solirubrobacteraceae bacterium]|nr:plastocyanin/azurin family copper-binding protein [Solirubrobacteraceae bacterium]
MRPRTLVAALATAAIACAGAIPTLASGGAHSSSVHDVVLKNIRFHPSSLSIKRGDTVTWLWQDKGTGHNVTGSGFKSKTMGHGSFSVRFTKSGTFNYHCTIHVHEGMVGKVVVH